MADSNVCLFFFQNERKDSYAMQLMEEMILKYGKVLPGSVLKVGSFLNQQVDSALLRECAREVARLYAGSGITKIVTIEASGIPFASAIALEMDVPMVFAKKHKTSNVDGDVLSAEVHSYTHNTDYTIVVSSDYISADDTLLLADDFLANGAALRGLMQLAQQAGAKVAGAAIEIEKCFQNGGDALREHGLRVESLACIESMEDGVIRFRA